MAVAELFTCSCCRVYVIREITRALGSVIFSLRTV